jgi:hypothetical protein
MTTIARAGNVDTNRIAVLACLHLQTRIQTLEAEIARFRSDVDNKTRRFAGMLDELIRAETGESA